MNTAHTQSVDAEMQFIPRSAAGGALVNSDLRDPSAGYGNSESLVVKVMNARELSDSGLATSGFELLHAPSAVEDFYDCNQVMTHYYVQCKDIATKLTGAHTTFTFDHIIREPGRQFNGGGTDGSQQQSGVASGGGHINAVHMDYTDRTTWDRYLELHGERIPGESSRVIALNFWRPISESVDDNPLAVCDARSVATEDLLEVDVYGYGASNYSWHNIGIETFSVSASPRHQWYYYPGMTPEDVLIIKSYDSTGVVGTTCPHASFAHPQPQGVERRSIELRVLCFC